MLEIPHQLSLYLHLTLYNTVCISTYDYQRYQCYGNSSSSNVLNCSINCGTQTHVRSVTVMFIWKVFTFCLLFSNDTPSNFETALNRIHNWGLSNIRTPFKCWAYLIFSFFFGSTKQRSLNLTRRHILGD